MIAAFSDAGSNQVRDSTYRVGASSGASGCPACDIRRPRRSCAAGRSAGLFASAASTAERNSGGTAAIFGLS